MPFNIIIPKVLKLPKFKERQMQYRNNIENPPTSLFFFSFRETFCNICFPQTSSKNL